MATFKPNWSFSKSVDTPASTFKPNWSFSKSVDTPASIFKPRWGTTEQAGERELSLTTEATLVVYAISLNFRRIRSGLAGLHWS